jgi:hypothetical protein
VYRKETSTELAHNFSTVIVRVPEELNRERMSTGTEVALEQTPPSAYWTLKRLASFFAIVITLVFALNQVIASGLRQIKTSQFGSWNQMMEGKVNAQVVVTGSSRAASHYDPRVIEAVTRQSAFNLGRNGSQTDMQVAVLKAYLEHNRRPEIVVHNLDAFTFQTTREVYAFAQYVPYLYDKELYQPLRKITPDTWKSRYLPLYGYVVDDMNFSWMLGIGGALGWSPKEDFFQGFNPRTKPWTDEFQSFKESNPNGVSWPIETEGVQVLEDLIHLCKERRIQLIFVYSPEYGEMQKLTNNRKELFGHFQELSARYHVPLWDYSDWQYASDTEYFTNSQHLNAAGAAVFSSDVANRLREYLAEQNSATKDLQAHQ